MTRSFIRSPLMTFVFWLVLSFMTLFPVWWMFLVSVRQRVDLFGTPSFLLDVSRMTWGNYQAVLSNPMRFWFLFWGCWQPMPCHATNW